MAENPKTEIRNQKSETGQSLLELALTITFMVLLVVAVGDLGRAYFTYVALGNAAGEGASYGSFYPDCPYAASGSSCADPDNIEYRARHESEQGLIDTTQITNVDVQFSHAPPAVGDTLTVTVLYNYAWITPFFRTFTGANSIELRSTAVQPIRSR